MSSGGPNPSTPELSIVMLVLNGVEHLPRQLGALAGQEGGRSFEVVVVDGGSTDGSVEMVEQWLADGRAGRILRDVVGYSAARNAGVVAAAAECVAHCDSDDLVANTWVDAICDRLARTDLVAGPTYVVPEGGDVRSVGGGRDPFDGSAVGPGKVHAGYLPFALTANVAYRRSVWDALGGFDNFMSAGEDVDFSWRAIEHGYRLEFEERMVVWKFARGSPRDRFRQHVRFGRADVQLFVQHADRGMPRFEPGVGREYLRLLAGVPRLVSPARRTNWMRRAGDRLGRLSGSLAARTLYP